MHRRYSTQRLVAAATDLFFRCGTGRLTLILTLTLTLTLTGRAAKAMSAAGMRAFLYQFDYHSSSYIDPDSLQCDLTVDIGCGVSA